MHLSVKPSSGVIPKVRHNVLYTYRYKVTAKHLLIGKYMIVGSSCKEKVCEWHIIVK